MFSNTCSLTTYFSNSLFLSSLLSLSHSLSIEIVFVFCISCPYFYHTVVKNSRFLVFPAHWSGFSLCHQSRIVIYLRTFAEFDPLILAGCSVANCSECLFSAFRSTYCHWWFCHTDIETWVIVSVHSFLQHGGAWSSKVESAVLADVQHWQHVSSFSKYSLLPNAVIETSLVVQLYCLDHENTKSEWNRNLDVSRPGMHCLKTSSEVLRRSIASTYWTSSLGIGTCSAIGLSISHHNIYDVRSSSSFFVIEGVEMETSLGWPRYCAHISSLLSKF